MESDDAYHMLPPRSSSVDYSCQIGPLPKLLFNVMAFECDGTRCGLALP
jgi:hypothetical protein